MLGTDVALKLQSKSRHQMNDDGLKSVRAFSELPRIPRFVRRYLTAPIATRGI